LDYGAYDMLMGHAGGSHSDHVSICRDADAMERLQWANEDMALAHVALDSLMMQVRQGDLSHDPATLRKQCVMSAREFNLI
jgi:hypothetical protein